MVFRNSKKAKTKSRVLSMSPKALEDPKEIEKIQAYLDFLRSGLEDKDITNIALTGIYGSGKSTILKTFQSLYGDFQYLNVSLASFKDTIQPSDPNSDPSKTGEPPLVIAKSQQLEREIEISVLQQIFYQVEPSKIPDSRFKRIIRPKPLRVFLWSLGILIWLFSCYKIIISKLFLKLNPSGWSVSSDPDWNSLVFLSLFIGGLFVMLYQAQLFFQNSSITKISIKGEISLGEKVKKSIFNQYLEEILYFFESTKYNVVVFEDIDRFKDSTDIFSKLREINTLLNANAKNRNCSPINFVYAVKDNLFNDKSQRVKFFDLVIPIIPFIDPSNADEQLQRLLEETGIGDDLSSEFVDDVVTFIDDIDMRLLINIVHEYNVYAANLPSYSLNKDELFAIIVYKNLFPNDFACLPMRRGKLYKILASRREYQNHLIRDIKSQIQSIEEVIESIETEKFSNIEQLRSEYVTELFNRIQNAAYIRIDADYTYHELLNEQNFEKFISSQNIQYRTFVKRGANIELQNVANSGMGFAEIEKEVDPAQSYRQREKVLKEKLAKKEVDLKIELEALNARVAEIERWSIKQLLNENRESPHLSTFKNNPLVINLILNGYLNENYTDYISLFHEVKLSKNDFKFKRNVKSGISTPLDAELEHFDNLIKKFRKSDFERSSILNNSLLSHLLLNSNDYEEQLGLFINTISKMGEKSLNFIDQYIEAGLHIGMFLQKLCVIHTDFWAHLLKSKYPQEKLERYLLLILKHVSITDLLKLNEERKLTDFINELPHFLEFTENISDERFSEVLDELMIRFKKIELPKTPNPDRLKVIYEHEYYELNRHNIELVIKKFNSIGLNSEFEVFSYTNILNSDCSFLITYVKREINPFVVNVLLSYEGDLSEDEEAFIELLNTESLDFDNKTNLILSWADRINVGKDISDFEVLQQLLVHNKIFSEWSNILHYYEITESKDLDETLIEFLNTPSNYKNLHNTVINYDDDIISSFFSSLIETHSISLESFCFLIRCIPDHHIYLSLESKEIEGEKVECLIKHKRVDYNEPVLIALRESFDGLLPLYFKTFENRLHELIEIYTISDLVAIFSHKSIAIATKFNLIGELSEEQMIESKAIGREVSNVLVESKYLSLAFETLDYLIESCFRSDVQKKLIIMHMSQLSNDELKILIEHLGDDYKKIFLKQYKRPFSKSEENIKIFDELIKRSMIMKYESYKKDKQKLRVFANY